MQTFGSVASVIAAIREDAAADVEHIEQVTASELAGMRKAAADTVITIDDRAERIAAARRTVAAGLAAAEWEGRRAVIEQREAWIARVVARAMESCAPDRNTLIKFATEALQQLPAQPCQLTVSQKDGALADAAWCAEVARISGKPSITVATSDAIRGGCIATCGDILFDNSIDARTRRREPEWRAAISKLYAVGS